MEGIEAGALVVANLTNPKEKVWGLLLRIDQVGVVIRGLDLNSVEDWLVQEGRGAAPYLVPSTQFFPIHRVDRIYLDESSAGFDSYGDRYHTRCGKDPREALRGTFERCGG